MFILHCNSKLDCVSFPCVDVRLTFVVYESGEGGNYTLTSNNTQEFRITDKEIAVEESNITWQYSNFKVENGTICVVSYAKLNVSTSLSFSRLSVMLTVFSVLLFHDHPPSDTNVISNCAL